MDKHPLFLWLEKKRMPRTVFAKQFNITPYYVYLILKAQAFCLGNLKYPLSERFRPLYINSWILLLPTGNPSHHLHTALYGTGPPHVPPYQF